MEVRLLFVFDTVRPPIYRHTLDPDCPSSNPLFGLQLPSSIVVALDIGSSIMSARAQLGFILARPRDEQIQISTVLARRFDIARCCPSSFLLSDEDD